MTGVTATIIQERDMNHEVLFSSLAVVDNVCIREF